MKGLLVGYGSIGRRHLANFHTLGVEDWVVVHTGKGTLPVEPPCPVRTYADLGDALLEEAPDFAVIANPTNLHVPTAIACIEADCAVLLEKPVSHTPEGLDELESAAAAHDVAVLVGFQFRFHPALARIRELLDSRAVGAPLHARVIWGEHLPSWHPWEDFRNGYAARTDLGGGVHHTICHPFDYLRMLFGDPVGVVASLGENGPLGLDVPECADVLLRFPDGVAAQVHLDYWTRPTAHRVEISCTDGTIHWDYITGAFRVWDASTEAWQPETFPGVDDRNDLFVAEAAHFLDVIAGNARPVCTLADGIETVRLCAEIEASAAGTSSREPP
ncbi:MAG: hypothetical protein QOG30_673 [Acidimicrobiaceae bacterium]